MGTPALSVSLDAGWNWGRFQGSASALKYNRRDLASIDAVLPFVSGRSVCVQAGGNLGIFPKALARVFETVYTFEPAPDLFQMLMQNAPEQNIVKFQAALGAAGHLVGLSRVRRDGKPDAHEGITHVSGDGMLPVLELDALCLPVVDLLYLDLEGYELKALVGAHLTIARTRPVIAVEVTDRHLRHYQDSAAELREWLQRERYVKVGGAQSDEFYVPEEAWPLPN